MNKIKQLILAGFFFLPAMVTAQVNGLVDDFSDGNITGWVADHPNTFGLSLEDGVLKIAYNRSATSDQWDNFNYTPASPINVTDNPFVTIKIKSSVRTEFTLKPIYSAGDNWLPKIVPGDNAWHTVTFNLAPAGTKIISKFYLYLDAGTTTLKSGTLFVDDFRVGDSVDVSSSLDYASLDKGINAAKALLLSTTEGSAEGQFPAGTKSVLQTAINSAQLVMTNGATSQANLDAAVWSIYDACVTYEKQAVLPAHPLVDQNTTRQTRYLYQNLQQLQEKAVLFGMHDATGYGVGWSGDNDRSDVKSVVGDYPAVYSEDLSGTDGNPNNPDQQYRMTTAFERGGIITMCWHQVDPLGRGFYAADVGNENIVKTILPGGSQHAFYKNKLKNAAIFFKSLRGSNGENIPIIFRPYHEHTGNWFWWGDTQCSIAEYNAIWKFTVNYLRDSLNVHNLLYAISPSSTNLYSGIGYERIYPGHDYVDIIGGDYYFGSPATGSDPANFLKFLQTLGAQSVKTGKVGAVTEVGQEGLKNADWYTKYLLDPMKKDSLAQTLVYAAVWRNANTSHHYAPYPGHASVPDFVKFYNDPYTLFEADLPPMYTKPVNDQSAPEFTAGTVTDFISPAVQTSVKVETNEKAYLRWSETSQPFADMVNVFTTGEGQYQHAVTVPGIHGAAKTIYVHARDLAGNVTSEPLKITFTVDTLQAPVYWSDNLYPVSAWSTGKGVLGSGSAANTKINAVKTAYFKKTITLAAVPTELAILTKGCGGMVIYINGKEAARFNMASGPKPDYATEPTVGGLFTKSLTMDATSRSYLVAGENTFAFEIHALSPGSVEQFDARIFTATATLVPYLSDGWSYYDKGNMPETRTLGEVVSVEETGNQVISSFTIYPNFPNPFNPSTRLRFAMPSASDLTIEVYDLLGSKVGMIFSGKVGAGLQEIPFNATGLASGVYMVRYQSGSGVKTQKIVLLK